MKNIIFIFFVTTTLSFSNGLRFIMEKDKIIEANEKITQNSIKKGNSEISSDNEANSKIKINTSSNAIKNKKRLLNDLLDKIEKEADTYLGTPYLWGGTTKKGIDCSAFIKNVYSKIGINLPRVSRFQAKVGKTIKLENIRKGDLIFFETDKNRPHTVSHVAMYIGNGKLIHASSSNKKVVIASLNQGYFLSKMVVIKRIVDILT